MKEVGARVPTSDVAPPQAWILRFLVEDQRMQPLIHGLSIRQSRSTTQSGEGWRDVEFHMSVSISRELQRARVQLHWSPCTYCSCPSRSEPSQRSWRPNRSDAGWRSHCWRLHKRST